MGWLGPGWGCLACETSQVRRIYSVLRRTEGRRLGSVDLDVADKGRLAIEGVAEMRDEGRAVTGTVERSGMRAPGHAGRRGDRSGGRYSSLRDKAEMYSIKDINREHGIRRDVRR